jgi:hypothetical protein
MLSGNSGKKAMVLPATCPSWIGRWRGHPMAAARRNQRLSHRFTSWRMLWWVNRVVTARVVHVRTRENR